MIKAVGAMARRRVIKSVLQNFLGTYTSRYTEYRGYWLFPFLVSDLDELEFDLLHKPAGALETLLAVSRHLAAAKFQEQLRKAGFESAQVRSARLMMKKSADAVVCPANGPTRAGYDVTFRAAAILDNGNEYECAKVVAVAPHDPLIEVRSSRGG
jgi:hypothetical protein